MLCRYAQDVVWIGTTAPAPMAITVPCMTGALQPHAIELRVDSTVPMHFRLGATDCSLHDRLLKTGTQVFQSRGALLLDRLAIVTSSTANVEVSVVAWA